MGRSKRERVVALTKTRKSLVGRDEKQKLLVKIRQHVDDYKNIYLFKTTNMRNTLLKQLREQWRDSRFFLGRNRIAQVAFGRSEAEEYAEGLAKLSESLKGNVGLLFTNRAHDEVTSFFATYEQADIARSGFVATETVKLAEVRTGISLCAYRCCLNGGSLRLPSGQLGCGILAEGLFFCCIS